MKHFRMISAIKRELFPACSDSNCFSARVSTKSLYSWKIKSPFLGKRGGWEEEFLWKKEPPFVALHSVFSARLDRRLGGRSGPPQSPLLLHPPPESRDQYQPCCRVHRSENPSITFFKVVLLRIQVPECNEF